MKVYVMYDDSGEIGGTFAPPSDSRRIGVKASDGMSVHSFDAPSLSGTERQKYLINLQNNHRIDISAGVPKLVPRSSTTSKNREGGR